MVVPTWLLFALRDDRAKQYFWELSSNTINISNLRTADLLSLSIPLPPLAEQKRIVAILNEQMAAVERFKKAAQEQLAEIEAMPSALLRQAFSGKL